VEEMMTANTAAHPNETARQPERDGRPARTELDRRYGEIGIMAVAAALRYAGAGKNPAYAPVAPRFDRRFEELVA